jgi:hypothetical protein
MMREKLSFSAILGGLAAALEVQPERQLKSVLSDLEMSNVQIGNIQFRNVKYPR